MKDVRYLSARDVVHIHHALVEETGGRHGIRDREALLSLEALPKQKVSGQELYPDIYSKASVYMRNIVMGHPFVEGNKRTGVTCAVVFLEDNGLNFIAKEGEVESFALSVIKERLDIPEIAQWLKANTKNK